MKKIAFLAVWLFAIAGVAQFNFGGFFNTVTNAAKVIKGTTGIGLQEELTIGNSVAVEIVAKYGGLVRDEAITHRVNLVGRSLALYCDRPELNFRFGVLNSPTVNAFSAPGGDVFITRGLYDLIQNDDQLAGVLGHEIGHVTKRHALKIVERGEAFDGIAGLASQNGGGDLRKYSQGVHQITTTLFEKGFDPKTEFEADREGCKLAAIVGYAPDGLAQCLTTLQQREQPGDAFFPTHPPLTERIKRLKALQTASR